MSKVKLTNLSQDDRDKSSALNTKGKIDLSEQVIGRVFDQVDMDKIGLAWTGGKDSTLLLWLIKNVCEREKLPYPKIVFVDEGDVFEEIVEFAEMLKKKWGFEFETIHNLDVSSKANELGAVVQVKDLSQLNQDEIKKLGYDKLDFPFFPESLVGNHLMKTVPVNNWLIENKIEVLITGVRWDEQEARSKDDFVREIENPKHKRLEPILHFSESDVWKVTKENNLPFVSLYEKGYRSLGAKSSTGKTEDIPAWEQDLENTSERSGRQQDKEKIMKRLRDLGYM